MKAQTVSKVKLVLTIYIAILITVLGVLVLHTIGTNNRQNRQIAEQARAIGESNRAAAIDGCHRGNFVRRKVNTVSGALTSLLRKSVQANEEKGVQLTPSQRAFLQREYDLLRPLALIDCKHAYPHAAPDQ